MCMFSSLPCTCGITGIMVEPVNTSIENSFGPKLFSFMSKIKINKNKINTTKNIPKVKQAKTISKNPQHSNISYICNYIANLRVKY